MQCDIIKIAGMVRNKVSPLAGGLASAGVVLAAAVSVYIMCIVCDDCLCSGS